MDLVSRLKSLAAVFNNRLVNNPKQRNGGTDEGSPEPTKGNDEHPHQFGRREFMKKTTFSAASLGALSLLPPAVAKINVRDNLEMHGNLTINEHTLYLSDTQPNNPEQGDVWIDTSTDT